MYKELLYLIYGNKLSTGNQRAEDIVTVIKTMQKAQVEVRTHYIYPALAHYSNEGNVQGYNSFPVLMVICITTACCLHAK